MESKSWLLLLISIVAISCGPNHYLRKAERAIDKAEKLGLKWKTDTVWNTIEVAVPEIDFDTVISYETLNDTITVTKDNIITRVKVNTVTKEIFVQTKCTPDTIKVKVPVIVNREIKAGKGFWHYALWFLIVAVIAFVAGYIIRSRTGKDLTINFDKEKE